MINTSKELGDLWSDVPLIHNHDGLKESEAPTLLFGHNLLDVLAVDEQGASLSLLEHDLDGLLSKGIVDGYQSDPIKSSSDIKNDPLPGVMGLDGHELQLVVLVLGLLGYEILVDDT